MKVFPKFLNTKADYEYIKNNFPAEQWNPCWQHLLDERKNWFPTGSVESEEAGIIDATHKVVKYESDGVVIFTQMELQDDPNCNLYRLGFTVEEVEAALASK
jgi:hypothetical protein